MKNNVDLTEERMFSRLNINDIKIDVHDMISSKFPWIPVDDGLIFADDRYLQNKNDLISTGNKHERKLAKNAINMVEGKGCLRCGKPIHKYLFAIKDVSLCRECEKYISRDAFRKKPWEFHHDMLKPEIMRGW